VFSYYSGESPRMHDVFVPYGDYLEQLNVAVTNFSRGVSVGTVSPALTERKLGSIPIIRLVCSCSVGTALVLAGGTGASGSDADGFCADWFCSVRFCVSGFSCPKQNLHKIKHTTKAAERHIRKSKFPIYIAISLACKKKT
jgi:hypothetical protein